SFYCTASHLHLHSFPTRRSSDLTPVSSGEHPVAAPRLLARWLYLWKDCRSLGRTRVQDFPIGSSLGLLFPCTLALRGAVGVDGRDRKSTRLNSSHVSISYAVFCL